MRVQQPQLTPHHKYGVPESSQALVLLLFEVIDPPRMLDQALRAVDGLPGILSARPSGSGASPAGSSPRRHAGMGQPVGY